MSLTKHVRYTVDVRYDVDERSCTDSSWVQVFLSHDGGHDNSPKATDGGEQNNFLPLQHGRIPPPNTTTALSEATIQMASLKFFCSVLPSEEAALALLVSDC